MLLIRFRDFIFLSFFVYRLQKYAFLLKPPNNLSLFCVIVEKIAFYEVQQAPATRGVISLITIHYSLFTIHSSLFTLHYSLFTIHSSLAKRFFASRSRLVCSVRRALPLRARGLRAPCASLLNHDAKVQHFSCDSKSSPSI